MTNAQHAKQGQRSLAQGIWLLLIFGMAAVSTVLVFQSTDWPREQAFMTGIFVLAALLWVTETLPLFATSLLVIGFELLLLGNPGDWPGIGFDDPKETPSYETILHQAAGSVLVLFFGGFILAKAAVKEGVDQALSALFLRPFGHKPAYVLLGMMLVTAIFSMWMSNTATTAMMIALTGPLLYQINSHDPFRKAVVLAVPFAANIGGIGTPIGSPPNAVAVGYLQQAGEGLAFIEWMLVADPLMLLMLFIAWQWLWWMYRPTDPGLELRPVTKRLSRRGWWVVGTFSVTVLAWLTDRWHGIPAAIVALFPASVFTATQILNQKDVDNLEWNILILIGGGLALGGGMALTGLDARVAGFLPTSGTSGLWLLACLVITTVLMSTFMSNTASANLLLPIGTSAAAAFSGNAGVMSAALAIALSASMAMALPISTPPNAIAYSRGQFSTKDLALGGVVLGSIAAVLIVLGIRPVVRLVGLSD